MDLNRLKTFYYVVKAGTISGACPYLKKNQSSISRQISSLEKKLGVHLFRRSHGGIELTKAGEILYEQVEKIMSLSELAQQSIKSHKEGLDGKLNLGTTHTLSAWLADYLPEFFEENPKIQMYIDTSQLIYDFDVVDVALGAFIKNRPDLAQMHIYTFELKLFASQKYLEKFGAPKNLEDLRKHRLLILDDKLQKITDTNWILSGGNTEYSPIKAFITVHSSSYTLAKLAQASIGIVQLGKDYPSLEKLDLIPVLPNLKGPQIPIYCIYPHDTSNNLAIQKFKKFLIKTFKNKND